jgi:hypothetical protein
MHGGYGEWARGGPGGSTELSQKQYLLVERISVDADCSLPSVEEALAASLIPGAHRLDALLVFAEGLELRVTTIRGRGTTKGEGRC